MEYLKVDGYDNLVRDPFTNSIINKDSSDYLEYVSRKKSKSKENEKIKNLEDDLESLKSDIDEIKNLLKRLAEWNQKISFLKICPKVLNM